MECSGCFKPDVEGTNWGLTGQTAEYLDRGGTGVVYNHSWRGESPINRAPLYVVLWFTGTRDCAYRQGQCSNFFCNTIALQFSF